jgi:hypothetical protein
MKTIYWHVNWHIFLPWHANIYFIPPKKIYVFSCTPTPCVPTQGMFTLWMPTLRMSTSCTPMSYIHAPAVHAYAVHSECVINTVGSQDSPVCWLPEVVLDGGELFSTPGSHFTEILKRKEPSLYWHSVSKTSMSYLNCLMVLVRKHYLTQGIQIESSVMNAPGS